MVSPVRVNKVYIEFRPAWKSDGILLDLNYGSDFTRSIVSWSTFVHRIERFNLYDRLENPPFAQKQILWIS